MNSREETTSLLSHKTLVANGESSSQGTAIASTPAMECYFGARPLPRSTVDGKSAVVMFNIPEAGIQFKAPFAGVDQDHCDLASMLALLEFIDSNQKYLAKQTYQLYGDNLSIINQVNGQSEVREEFVGLLGKAAQYRDKYRFSLNWVPPSENPASDELLV
jgi:hypothetical protein